MCLVVKIHGCKKKGWSQRRVSVVLPVALGIYMVSAFTEMEQMGEDKFGGESRVPFGTVKFEMSV